MTKKVRAQCKPRNNNFTKYIRMLCYALAFAIALSGLLAWGAAGLAVRAMASSGEEAGSDVDETAEMLKLDEELPEAIAVSGITDASIPAKSAIMIDQAQGQVLYEKNPDEPLPPASVTKIMTLLLVIEAIENGRISLEDIVSASDYACSMGGSQIWLKPGEEMSVNDLLKAVAISSANDASVALGEHIAGTNDAFVDMMNIRAQDLGMNNTHFLNCTGLDEPGHLTTARDISIMSREVMKYPLIRDYTTVWMDSLRGGQTELVNTNRLVRFYGGTTGLKTGTTNGAGSCLSATAEREELGLVAVVMGCPTSDERFQAARSLLDYGFANYVSATPPPIDGELVPVKVLHGVKESVAVTYSAPGSFVVNKNSKDSIRQEITLVEDVEAPVALGQTIGKVEIIIDGAKAGEYDLKAAEECGRMTLLKAFGKLLLGLLDMSGRGEADTSAPEGEVPPADIESSSAPEPPDQNGADASGNTTI